MALVLVTDLDYTVVMAIILDTIILTITVVIMDIMEITLITVITNTITETEFLTMLHVEEILLVEMQR